MALGVAEYDFGDQFQRHSLAVLARIPGAVLRYRSALDSTYYGSATLRQISEALFEHVDEHKALPQRPTLIEDLRERVGEEEFERVEKSVRRMYREDVTDAQAVLERMIDFGKQQAFVNATLRAADQIEKGKRDVRPLFDAAAVVGEDLLDLGVDYTGTVDARRAYYKDPEKHEETLRTGIPHVDALLGGGLGRGELGVILAPPKKGKTTTLINIGFGALTSPVRYNVVHYSNEMHQDRVTRRYDDRLMGPRIDIRTDDPERYGELLDERVRKFIRGSLFVKHYPTRTATVGKLRSHLSMLAARKFHPDVIIVDYADIMKADRRLGEMRHEQAGIYEDLRQLAGEFNCAVWTGSQATRGALEKDIITINDFAETFEKAAIVDVALAFCQTDDERIEQRCRLFAAALRNTEDGRTIECEINRSQARIRSVALFDVAGERMLLPGEKSDERGATTNYTLRAKKREDSDKLKEKVGIKKGRHRREAEKTARRRPERLTKAVAA